MNPRNPDLQSGALPLEPSPRNIEPSSNSVENCRSQSHWLELVGAEGFGRSCASCARGTRPSLASDPPPNFRPVRAALCQLSYAPVVYGRPPADLNRALPVMSRPLSPGELWAVMVSSAGVEPADDAELKAAAYANSATRTLPFESPTAFTCTAGRAAPAKANTRRVTDIAPMSAQAWRPDLNAVALTRYIYCLHNALLPQWLLVPAPGVEPGNSEF